VEKITEPTMDSIEMKRKRWHNWYDFWKVFLLQYKEVIKGKVRAPLT
jgi:hypothetical protein